MFYGKISWSNGFGLNGNIGLLIASLTTDLYTRLKMKFRQILRRCR